MSKLSEQTKIDLTPKNLVTIILLVISMTGMYYSLQAQIQEAKLLPAQPPINSEITDALIKTNTELEFIKQELSDVKQQLQIMEERLYELK
jgi:hypothetical protein